MKIHCLSRLVIKNPFRYLFRSGSIEHPSDKLYNTTVEVLPDQLNEESLVWQQYNTTTDGFLIIGNFNAMGFTEGVVDNRIGKLREMRLHVHTESENWVILSEVSGLEYFWNICRIKFRNFCNFISSYADSFDEGRRQRNKMIEKFHLVMNISTGGSSNFVSYVQ